jgi:hypothetical protein
MKRILERVAVPLIAAIIGAAIVGGVAIASIPDGNGTIHGCYSSTGTLRVIDAATQSCASGQTALNWNQQGPRGPSNVFAVYHDTKTTVEGTGTTLDSEKVPAGSYVFIAKLTLSDGSETVDGYCTLTAGGDVDTQVAVASKSTTGGTFLPMTLTVVHTATSQIAASL